MIISVPGMNCKIVFLFTESVKKNHNPLNSCNSMTKKIIGLHRLREFGFPVYTV